MDRLLEYNLFGFNVNAKDFNHRLCQSENLEQLGAVAIRVYLIDRLRYRLRFTPALFLSTPDLNYRLGIEKQALELHLLCTCIDALAGKDFLSFPEWLAVSKPAKKAKHRINDSIIELAIRGMREGLCEPDVFRRAATQVYKNAYLPQHGNHKAFLRYFDSLPDSLKKLLTEIYVMSDPLDEDDISREVKDGASLPNDIKAWNQAREKWQTKSLDQKIRSIAEYFYSYHRNPYTHKARSVKPRVTADWSEILGMEVGDAAWDPINDVIQFGGKYRIVRFKADPGEDESIMLRLVVAVGWLKKLGYQADEDFVRGFRKYQVRRESMYNAMYEIEVMLRMWRYYTGEDEEHSPYSATLSLPKFPISNIDKLRPHLYKTTSLEGGIDGMIKDYLNRLGQINEHINNFNTAHIPPFPGVLDLDMEERRLVKEARDEAYESIRNITTSRDITGLAHKIYEWLDLLVDRMV